MPVPESSGEGDKRLVPTPSLGTEKEGEMEVCRGRLGAVSGKQQGLCPPRHGYLLPTPCVLVRPPHPYPEGVDSLSQEEERGSKQLVSSPESIEFQLH